MNQLGNAIINNNLNIFWYSYAMPKNLTASELRLLYNAGCRMLRLGVESGSEKIQKLMKKYLMN